MIGIINYGAGNIFSLTAALDRVGLSYMMINLPEEINQCDRIIIPGVGHAGAAMQKLRESGLSEHIHKIKKPVLGICVGMQLMTDFSEEGNAELLKIVPIQTLHFRERIAQKVPHMGWNSISPSKGNPLFLHIEDNAYFYFVHSYFIEYHEDYTIAKCEYDVPFSAAMSKGNFYGVQFHPEKSGKAGEQLLLNFSKIN
ncbi:imidazole glycerol phosphate synthase, glutamine amidotransferase subunit [Sphingobacterium spiritivorum ATCC 33300]|uniref:Imidazole glycerol phosphate synthase subunit HisH n=1 Tax=Sphingobacterium spiritivorum ATCC 33300 TaxID=525372 RepID=C2FZQ5_SPHSI|nr:imidazole glycerol phosphate synthase subunit HisH [Sphingobacterium spiritivorum]EEI91501.1 imidazole glycerol phosphate synthase, glutamine amidotransferase subunit [Sphingobacterium spiritivorum ATCC 33300]QQS97225.1 imidazole glycerol phosphate synthase subunit HisH [Sphingobacterium spiritivorum]